MDVEIFKLSRVVLVDISLLFSLFIVSLIKCSRRLGYERIEK